eukprot:TRINITY_DN1983_c0_g2_i1.p1 TRINITY_DN1983_c0_g2~~TRINITY_DN1983_c0_g2_i1.p1  ORF type:complete len:521 (-),score=52.22 TRINITY_DN1983_c0_g2_i1:331-1893(-)
MGNEQSGQLTTGDQSPVEIQKLPPILVICGPSGVGKGTLINNLMQTFPGKFGFSVSHTTRDPRAGEKEGVHYYFTSMDEMKQQIKNGQFLEFAEVHGRMYGTSVKAVEEVLLQGKVCILDIDVQGARQVRQSGLKAIFIFISPPNAEELERRLLSRNTETKEQIAKRLAAARSELESSKEEGLFDVVIVNDNLEQASIQLCEIGRKALEGLQSQQEQAVQQNEQSREKPTQSKDSAKPTHSRDSVKPTNSSSSAKNNPTYVIDAGMEKWRNKVALVTGASSGIGWAVCAALAQAGMKVVAIARRKDRLEQLQKYVLARQVHSENFLAVVCDVSRESEVVTLPRIVASKMNAGIDVLVNNAGLARSDAGLFDGNTQSYVEMLSTNILGLQVCTREVLKSMENRKTWGHIINISSVAAHKVIPNMGFYCATKHAVQALSEGLRQDARERGVPLRVSQISPGRVETEFRKVYSFGDQASAQKFYSQMENLQPEDIAQAVIWCLSAPQRVEVNDIVVRPTAQSI